MRCHRDGGTDGHRLPAIPDLQHRQMPMGIATQDAALRSNLNVEKSARRLENFLFVVTNELIDFSRLTGNKSIHGLSVDDLCTVNSEISQFTSVAHV
jgi:hypothetical protein